MSKYRELELLREQEHTLKLLHMNFCDQLNRLKGMTLRKKDNSETQSPTSVECYMQQLLRRASKAGCQLTTPGRVEELALTNLLRLQKEREMQAQAGPSQQIGPQEEAIEQEAMEVLNLLVHESPTEDAEEEEEEEEEEMEEMAEEEEEESAASYTNQLNTFLEDLLHQQQEENQQLQLSVNPEGGEEDDEEDDET